MPGSTNNIPLIFDTTNNTLKEIPFDDKIIFDVMPQTIPLDGSVTSSKIASGVNITFSSGSTAVPAIRIGNGNSVGIYSPDTNVFAISTAGQERFRINADGNITLSQADLPTLRPNWTSKVNTIYVNPSDYNSTDSLTNDGGNISRPFKTIQRALLEAAKKSYVVGSNNDKFEAYTIMVFPGEYVIDNRPGDSSSSGFSGYYNTWLSDENQIADNLYRFNPATGGVIVPRGTSIVGYDLRKTVIRPRFVPHPENITYPETAIFKVTGGCYFWQMTFKDVPSFINESSAINFAEGVYTTGTSGTTVVAANTNNSLFSHHKVVCFAYANQTTGSSGELNTYYDKVDSFYSSITLQTRLEEYQIVGPGNSRTTIDTVNSASPYIFNCSLRSVFGLCGMNADGSKVEPNSFKSMVVAQFTGISLQRDSNAFWQPKTDNGIPTTGPTGTNPTNTLPIYADPDAEYKINYRHYHIKAQNRAFIQIVSVFAVGYADQFIAITGGDMSITNSNSNFGQISLRAISSNPIAFEPSAYGKITAIIPPRGISKDPVDQEFYSINHQKTWEKSGQVGTDADEFVQSNLNNFLTNSYFKIYLNIPGVNSEEDIPESIVETKDYYTGEIVLKRYLTYGSNNLNLFRNYYTYSGTVNQSEALLYTTVEIEDGSPLFYSCQIKLTPDEGNIKENSGNNLQRQGYFWDSDESKVYIKVDYSSSASRNFLNNYIFKKVNQVKFKTTTETNLDGSVSVISGPQNVDVLEYFNGFPSPLTTRLLVDNRSSTPSDLLWRVEYTIPKNISVIPKPPEKRFIIKGSNNREFQIYDVQEIQSWEKDTKDGVYYLTIIRSDVDDFVDWNSESNFNTKVNITRNTTNYTSLTGLYSDSNYGLNDSSAARGYRVSSNINYLYPSVVEDAVPSISKNIWNPPIADSRVLIEEIGAGKRVKDVSVPNKKYYKSIDKTISSVEYRNPENTYIPIQSISYATGNTYVDITVSNTPAPNYQNQDLVNVFINDPTGLSNFGSGSRTVLSVSAGAGTSIIRVAVDPTSSPVVAAGSTGTIYNSTINVQLNSVEGLFIGKNVEIVGNPNTRLNGIRYIYNIFSNTIRLSIVGAGISQTGADTSGGIVGTTPFYDSPSLYSITAEAIYYLCQSFNLKYLMRGYSNTTKTYSETYLSQGRSMLSDVVSNSIWNAGGSVDINSYVYGPYGKVRYGNSTNISGETNTSLSDLNNYGLDDTPENRKIICVTGTGANLPLDNPNNSTAIQNLAPTVPLYRPSIIRASSHTWEYIGLGSGNYSTAFPNVQTRVLKPYEQYIAQGYENGGGFVASSGTNSNGDQYIGNQVIQAGGQSTVTLNVPKVRKTSETNFIDVSNIENRISNSVINVTSSTARNSTSQALLKGLSNFFNTARLSVSDRASISNLNVTDSFRVNITNINNGEKYPEGNTEGYGFVKAAKPEKTGFISTDTNDKLYVSPKYLDAWRLKRNLLSGSNVQLDNNRIYVQPNSTTVLDGSTFNGGSTTGPVGLGSTYTSIRVKESNGLPSSGNIDIEMILNNVNFSDTDSNGYKLNPRKYITLNYTSVDYTNNVLTLNPIQNGLSLSTYISNILGSGNTYRNIIKDIPSPLKGDKFTLNSDPKYVSTKLTQSFTAKNIGTGGTTIYCTDLSNFPDRGSVILGENFGAGTSQIKYSTYIYNKINSTQLNLISRLNGLSVDNVTTTNPNGVTFTGGGSTNNVFFGGCSTVISLSDRWAYESPFIPFLEVLSEDVDLESATLYEIPKKTFSYTGSINSTYTNSKVPNPYSSKSLGANLQTRSAVKKFEPFSSLRQCADWANQYFTETDTIEILMKPGYYKLDNASFKPSVIIRGSGVSRTGGSSGKEITSVGASRIGGYKNTSTKRSDSVYFFRSPSITTPYNTLNDDLYIINANKITFASGVTLENIHFLDQNSAILENEILDSYYSSNDDIASARKTIRRAYYVKNTSEFATVKETNDFVSDGLSFNFRSEHSFGTGATAKFEYYIKNSEVVNNNGSLNSANKSDCRYVVFTLKSTDFGSGTNATKYKLAKRYIIPGSTLYFLPTGGSVTNATQETRIIDVVIENENPTTNANETIKFICSVNDNDSITNALEDLSLTDYVDGSVGKIVITNKPSDPFSLLVYNTGLNFRKKRIPNGFGGFGGLNTSSNTDIFNNPIIKYDTPRLYGISRSFTRNAVYLIIDLNPSFGDKSVTAFPNYFNNCRSGLLRLNLSQNEDSAIEIPYKYIGNIRLGSSLSRRFVSLEVNPRTIASSLENINYNSTILSQISSLSTSSFIEPNNIFLSFNDFASIVRSNLYAASQIYSIGSGSTSVSISGTGGTFTVSTGVLQGTGTSFRTEVSPGDLLLTGTGTTIGVVESVNSDTQLTIRNNTLKYTSNLSNISSLKKLVILTEFYNNYPNTYRYGRKRQKIPTFSGLGNISLPLIDSSSTSGNVYEANLRNVTIGAQSPSDTINNRFGGSYGGGLLNLRNKNLTLSGLRVRGNITTDFSGLFVSGGLRAISQFKYGHSVDLFQLIDSVNVKTLGSENPPKLLQLGRNDEQYLYMSEFYNSSLNYFEPSLTPSGNEVDYDQRVFPVTCLKALSRFNSDGSLNTNPVINERYLTPNNIVSSESSIGNSGWNLTFSTGNTLTFNYTTDAVTDNIFTGTYATKIVNPDNLKSVYATVTSIDTNIVNGTKTATITYSGTIPEGTTSIKFLTTYLQSQRYDYITTATSRYKKTILNGRSALLLASGVSTVYAQSADIVVNGTGTASLSRTLVTFNSDKSTRQVKAYVELNSAGQIISFDPISYGYGTGGTEIKAGHILTAVGNIGSGFSSLTFVPQRNLSDDIGIFEPGEYIAVPPPNCFILNNIFFTGASDIKSALEQAKTIFKPYDYILYNGIYYRIANNDTNKSYIGVYRYCSPNNLNDIRTSIVVRLEEVNHRPTYDGNVRFDVFSESNLLNLWPSSGRLLIDTTEMADFTISSGNISTGYQLNLSRDMTKYYPSYIRDWDGLDPDLTDDSSGIGAFTPFTLTLSDPVDLTCGQYRRIFGSSSFNGITSTTVGTSSTTIISPTGVGTSDVSVIRIPAGTGLTETSQKYNIGDIVSIPYRYVDLDKALIFTFSAATGTTGTYTSTNRAGDVSIIGKASSGSTYYFGNAKTFQILPYDYNNYNIFNSVNPAAVVTFGSGITFVPESTIGLSGTGITQTLDISNALFSTVSSGTTVILVPEFRTASTSTSESGNASIFRSRIVDIKYGSGTSVDLILSDKMLPIGVGTSFRHFGFFTLNHGGWTYPRSGASAFRPNNIKVGSASTEIFLMNNSNRIKRGDQISYNYAVGANNSTFIGFIREVSDADSYGYSKCIIEPLSGTNILHSGYSLKSNWLSISDIYVTPKNANYDGPALNTFFNSPTGVKLSFSNYRMWLTNYGLFYKGVAKDISGRQGFVGNFGINSYRSLCEGFNFGAFSEIKLGSQYGDSKFWSIATPVTPSWAIRSLYRDTIEYNFTTVPPVPNYLSVTSSSSRRNIVPLNHTAITTDTIYSTMSTSSILSGGMGSYDTLSTKFYGNSNIRYSIQNGVVSDTGTISGTTGYGSRSFEVMTTSSLIHYKPALDFTSSVRTDITPTLTWNGTSITSGGTDLLPGDVVYNSNNDLIGIVSSDTSKFAYTAISSGSGISTKVISPDGLLPYSFSAGTTAGLNAVGENVITNTTASHDLYNTRFVISARNYNGTPYINSTNSIKTASSVDNARRVCSVLFGDLTDYSFAGFNVRVTRFNKKVHLGEPITITIDADI